LSLALPAKPKFPCAYLRIQMIINEKFYLYFLLILGIDGL
jgi:hypothetical protein